MNELSKNIKNKLTNININILYFEFKLYLSSINPSKKKKLINSKDLYSTKLVLKKVT